MAIINQILTTGVICYVCTTYGILYTWPSFTIKYLGSANTTLDRVMTETEISVLGSMSLISALIITPFYGYMIGTLGRKWCCIIYYIEQLLAWLIIVSWYKVEAVLFAMFLFGLSTSCVLVVPIYVSEYCQESIRGSMASCAVIFFSIGILLSYLLGGLLEYKIMNYAGLTLTTLGLVGLSFMKESPLHLMQKGREMEAAKAIAFFRGLKMSSKGVQQEIENIKRILNTDVGQDTPPEEMQLNLEGQVPKTKLSPWKYLIKSRSSRRALLVSMVLYFSSVFQGLAVMEVYAEPMFQEAVPSMSPLMTSVLSASVAIVALFFASYLIEVIGRRLLMIYASLTTGVCCALLGSQIHCNWGPIWLTAVLILVYCAALVVGAGTVPYIISAEVFLPEIKSFASMISIEWELCCSFLTLFIYHPLVTAIGLGPVFYLFSVNCFLTVVFCYFYLPETRGLPVDAIQKRFLKRANLL